VVGLVIAGLAAWCVSGWLYVDHFVTPAPVMGDHMLLQLSGAYPVIHDDAGTTCIDLLFPSSADPPFHVPQSTWSLSFDDADVVFDGLRNASISDVWVDQDEPSVVTGLNVRVGEDGPGFFLDPQLKVAEELTAHRARKHRAALPALLGLAFFWPAWLVGRRRERLREVDIRLPPEPVSASARDGFDE